MSHRRTVGSLVVMGGFLLLLTATSKSRSSSSSSGYGGGSSASSSGSTVPFNTGGGSDNGPMKPFVTTGPTDTTTPAPTTGGAAVVMPDVDVPSVRAVTGCTSRPTHPFCTLLTQFDVADVFTDVPAAETVYFGQGTAIQGTGDGQKEFEYLRIGRAGATSLGAASGVRPEGAAEHADANRLFSAVRVGSVAPGSTTASWLKSAVPSDGRKTVYSTRGKSLRMIISDGTSYYIRRFGTKLLMLEYNGAMMSHKFKSGTVTGRAWLTELWRLNQ